MIFLIKNFFLNVGQCVWSCGTPAGPLTTEHTWASRQEGPPLTFPLLTNWPLTHSTPFWHLRGVCFILSWMDTLKLCLARWWGLGVGCVGVGGGGGGGVCRCLQPVQIHTPINKGCCHQRASLHTCFTGTTSDRLRHGIVCSLEFDQVGV